MAYISRHRARSRSSVMRSAAARILYARGLATRAVLREEARHHHVAVILRTRVLAIATIELLGHPLWERALMRLDGCQFLGVAGHVVREGVRQLGRQGLT